MSITIPEQFKLAIPSIVEQVPYLKLLVLFGSRSRADNHPNSDWDFAVLYDEDLRQHYETGGWDWLRIWTILQTEFQLADQQIDIVILNQCSQVLRHTIARESQPLYEHEPGEFERFRTTALMSEAAQSAYVAEKRAEIRAALARWKS
jgi:predicted nucleotidyltransferase